MTLNDYVRGPSPLVAARAVELALSEGALRTLFQPIVDLTTDEVVGYEALTRGPATAGVESPDALFAAARSCRRLAELDWACRCQAFRTATQAALRPPDRLFVNAEPQVLGTACPDHLLRDWVSAHRRLRVVIEVTERHLCDAPGDLLRVAATLHELGWEVALDDVGANDAGVALLPVLRPDIVKLDMGLMAPRLTRAQRQVMAAVETYVARSGAHVVAEGLETEQHRRRAVDLGADWGQGWLLGRPGPLASGRTAGTGKPARVGARPGADPRVRADPFRLLAAAQDRRAQAPRRLTEAEVVATVGEACQDALTLSGGSLALVALGRSSLAPVGLRHRLARLRDVCALVVLLAGEDDLGPGPVVRTTLLDDVDPLRSDAAVVLLSPERALAFHARQASDGSWTARSTTDADEVGESARALLTRADPVERDAVLTLHRPAAVPRGRCHPDGPVRRD